MDTSHDQFAERLIRNNEIPMFIKGLLDTGGCTALSLVEAINTAIKPKGIKLVTETVELTQQEKNRFTCKIEDCELSHCRRCGHHYDPYCAYGRSECDGCQIEDSMVRTEREVASCEGDTNLAAKLFDWDGDGLIC